MTYLTIGDLVTYPPDSKYILASGNNRYACAVVMQVDPVILVSEEADMKWTCTVGEEHLVVIGRCTDEVYAKCYARIAPKTTVDIVLKDL